MGVALRWQVTNKHPRLEAPLDASYTLDDVQRAINFAIENGGELGFLKANGETLRFPPTDVELLSVVVMGEP